MKVGVTGAAGMLGTAILDRLAGQCDVFAAARLPVYCPSAAEWRYFDLLDAAETAKWLRDIRPEVVVHCAALVNVDACEKRPAEALHLHATTTRTIGETMRDWGGRIVYISTDSVFNGRKPGLYTEEDTPDPPNTYAATKLAGERAALEFPGSVVLRTNIFGWSRAEKISFAEWVLRGLKEQLPLTMFTDVTYTPIHVSHLAEIINGFLPPGSAQGLFHAGGSTVLSKHAFAMRMADIFGLDTASVVPCSVDDVGLSAARPRNMALSSQALSDILGCEVPEVDEGIRLMKFQYDSGWLARVKGQPIGPDYRVREAQ